MNAKGFLTLAGVINLFYGLWYFLGPQNAADAYGYGLVTTDLSTLILQFLGISFIAAGVMCVVARGAEKSAGRTR